MINKEIKTKNGILIIIAATLMILSGILLTNIDLIFGAGTGDADTLDSMDWSGDDCSGVDCNIKDYIDAKSTPCASQGSQSCYATGTYYAGTTQTVSNVATAQSAGYYAAFNLATVDADLTAGNIKNGINIFGVAGSVVAKDPLASSQCFQTMTDDRTCRNGATNGQTSAAYCIARGFTSGYSIKNDYYTNGCLNMYWNANTGTFNWSCNTTYGWNVSTYCN